MWKSIFLALGIFTFVMGVESLLIDSATFASHAGDGAHDLVPAEWAPWSLMSAGAVVVLYSFTLPQKLKGG